MQILRLAICLIFTKNQAWYAYKRYAYKIKSCIWFSFLKTVNRIYANIASMLNLHACIILTCLNQYRALQKGVVLLSSC